MEAVDSLNRLIQSYRLFVDTFDTDETDVTFKMFVLVFKTNAEYFTPVVQKLVRSGHNGTIRMNEKCLRYRQDYFLEHKNSWGYWMEKPPLDNKIIRRMYLEEKKEERDEKRFAFLSGSHKWESSLYHLNEPMILKHILEFSGLITHPSIRT